MKNHILLTSLGMAAKQTTYELDGAKANKPLAPLALMEILKCRGSSLPNCVVAVVTNNAKKQTGGCFHTGIHQQLGFVPKWVSIRDSKDVGQILEDVAKHIPANAELTLDVTQGLRHFPFIFYALVLYLKSLRGVKIRGAYYGMFEAATVVKPIIDLQPLLELPEWFYAVRMFRDQGMTEPMAQLIQPLADRLNKKKNQLFIGGHSAAGKKLVPQVNQVNNVIDSLKEYSFAYESALPLELGKNSRALCSAIEKLDTGSIAGLPPLAKDLMDAISKAAGGAALDLQRRNWKTQVQLDQEELKRQARMIDLYLDRGQLPLAVGLMREWVVSWAIFESGETENWLDHRRLRKQYERRLGAIQAFAQRSESSNIEPEQKEFGDFWNDLVTLRNGLHHHGMQTDVFTTKELGRVRCFWNQLKEGKIDLPELGGGGGKLLLSSQGTKPGVLFSALKVAAPDSCLVICSAASASSIDKARNKAGFKGSIERIELDDPHGDFDAIKKCAEQASRHLLVADEVVANVTGGTTWMGLVVQQLVEQAQRLDRPVRRFALIDRRPPADQDRNPFVQGEHHWID